jgi:hypothetical protein
MTSSSTLGNADEPEATHAASSSEVVPGTIALVGLCLTAAMCHHIIIVLTTLEYDLA